MNKYNFDNVVNFKGSNSYRWDVKDGELPLTIADMDFHVLPEIKEAILKRSEIDAYGYVGVPNEYYESYQKWWRDHHGVNFDTEWMTFSTSVVGTIDCIFKHFLKPNEEVAIFSPVYNVFFNCIKNNNLIVDEIFFDYKDNKFEINFDLVKSILKKEKVKAILLCNPHNPIGKIFTKEELHKICKIASENDVLIISDEIHCDLISPGKRYVPCLLACNEYKDKIITLLAPTKTFNIAGIKSSIAVIPNKELKEKLAAELGHDDIGEPNIFSSPVTIAAFNYGDEYVKKLNEYLYRNKKYLCDFIKDNSLKLNVELNDATYLMWIDISSYSNDSADFCNKLRETTGLILASGINYGSKANSFVRINIATSLENIKDCCQRLKKFLLK